MTTYNPSDDVQPRHSAMNDGTATRAELLKVIASLREQVQLLESRFAERPGVAQRFSSPEGGIASGSVDDLIVQPVVELQPRRSGLRSGELGRGAGQGDEQRAYRFARRQFDFTRAITDSLGEGVYCFDHAGRLTFMNPAAQTISGWRTGELLGKDVGWLISAADETEPVAARAHLLPLSVLVSGETCRGDDVELSRKDGSRCPVRFVASPIYTDGQLAGGVVAFHDVTQEKQTERALRQSERNLRETFEQAAVGIAHVALDGRLLRANRRLCEILGYTHDSLTTHTFADLTYAEDAALDSDLLTALVGGQRAKFSLEKRCMRYNGETVWVLMTVSLVRDDMGAPEYFIHVVQDISERRRLEHERAQLYVREQQARLHAEELAAEMRALQSVADSALSQLALDPMLDELLTRVREVIRVDSASILLLDDEHRLHVRAAHNVNGAVAVRYSLPANEGFVGQILTTGRLAVVEDLHEYTSQMSVMRNLLRSMAGVPLTVGERILGVLHVGSVQLRTFDDRDLRLLQLAAARIAVAIDRAQQYERADRARAEAVAEAQRLETIFETITEGVAVFDADGRVSRANSAFNDLLLLDLTDPAVALAETPSFHLTHSADGTPLLRDEVPSLRILQGERLTGSQMLDVHLVRQDGQEFGISISGAPTHGPDGAISGGVLVVHDVTERAELQRRSSTALHALVAMAETMASPPTVQNADLAGGGDEDEAAASTAPSTSHLLDSLARLMRAVLTCDVFALTAVDADGSSLTPMAIMCAETKERERWWHEITGSTVYDYLLPDALERLLNDEMIILDQDQPLFARSPIRYQRTMLIVPQLCGRRLTHIAAIEYRGAARTLAASDRALVRAFVRLAQVVAQHERLQRERDDAAARILALQETQRRMMDFLRVATHELRTPVTTLTLSLHVLEQQAEDDVARELVQRAQRNVERLSRLIDDVLESARIREGQMPLRLATCDVRELVRAVVEEQRIAHPDRRIVVPAVPEQLCLVQGDADRLQDVVTNLLSNALKYSDVSQPVEVEIERVSGQVRVAVRDFGPGIPAEECARIWMPFYRVESISVLNGSGVGFGLGLHIARAIVERHGGALDVETVQGQGSTFWMSLPALA